MIYKLKCIVVFFFLFASHLLAQSHLDYGKVLFDKNFSCNSEVIKIEWAFNNFTLDSVGLKTICESQNELEIRFYSYTPMIGSWYLYVLAMNNGKWSATEYSYNLGWKGFDNTHPLKVYNLIPKIGYASVFTILKQNNIFTLPEEPASKYVDFESTDQAHPIIAYKVQNQFRRYRIFQPHYYGNKYPADSIFDNYSKIIDIFRYGFDKYN